MEMSKQPKLSSIKIRHIEINTLNFIKTSMTKEGISMSIDISTGGNYRFIGDSVLEVTFGVKVILFQKCDEDEINKVATCECVSVAHVEYRDNFDIKLTNNVAAILYSYMRPIIAQISAMSKVRTEVDLPILDLTCIELEEIKII